MNAYATPAQVILWTNTTPDIAGLGCAPVRIVEQVCGILLAGKTHAAVETHEALRRRQTRESAFVEPAKAGRLPVFIVDDPETRLRLCWQNYLTCPSWRARNSARMPGAFECLSYPDFLRWVMYQDPLMVDEMVRPQWASVPDGSRLVRLPEMQTVHNGFESEMCARIVRTLYAHDFPLYDRAEYVPNLDMLSAGA